MGRLVTGISTNTTKSQACFWLMGVPYFCQKAHTYDLPLPQYTFFRTLDAQSAAWVICRFWTLLVCRCGPTAVLGTDTRQETAWTCSSIPFPHSAHVAWPRSSGKKQPLGDGWCRNRVIRSHYTAPSKTATPLQYRAFFLFLKSLSCPRWCPCSHRQC